MTETASPPARREPAGAFPRARTVVTVRGVPVRVDVSWLFIAGLVLVQFATRFELLLGDLGPVVVFASAAAAALLFFVSLLAHELGHAFTSLDRDIPVLGITLFLMGGVTESTKEAVRARDEFVIVGIGPFISLVLAALFGLLYTAVVGVRPVAVVFGYLAWTNLLLAIFNLVPGYPLDGGRLLRSILWGATGRPHAATRWAARVGQAVAIALALLGIRQLTASGGFGGIWQILIALFLFRGAADSHRRARLRERLGARTAGEVMGSAPPTLPADLPLEQAVARIEERPSLLWPVGDPLVGVVTLADLDAVPRDDWPFVPLGRVARALDGATVDADAPMDTVLDRLVHGPGGMLLVVRDGRPVGLLTPSLVTDLV
jgi:Zn-dependent protease/CBS domain-containing protein